jgi:hypothetical protein
MLTSIQAPKQEELKIDKDSLAVSSPKDPGYAAFVMQSTL